MLKPGIFSSQLNLVFCSGSIYSSWSYNKTTVLHKLHICLWFNPNLTGTFSLLNGTSMCATEFCAAFLPHKMRMLPHKMGMLPQIEVFFPGCVDAKAEGGGGLSQSAVRKTTEKPLTLGFITSNKFSFGFRKPTLGPRILFKGIKTTF